MREDRKLIRQPNVLKQMGMRGIKLVTHFLSFQPLTSERTKTQSELWAYLIYPVFV